ncbi:ABC transporter permease OS=Streptomyces tendae OX=1932 GN=GUR47_29860 PE=4 SV=1 [Streptomyces tendae]
MGCGVYLMLMALFAAGLTTLFRSGVATLSTLVPLILVVSFVIGDAAGTPPTYLPGRAGQIALYRTYDGTLGPWTGLAVTALWAAVALLAGFWRLRRRDA